MIGGLMVLTAAAVPLVASSAWQAEFTDERCSIRQAFGSRPGEIVLELQSRKLSGDVAVNLHLPTTPGLRYGQTAKVTVKPSGDHREGPIFSLMPDDAEPVVSIPVSSTLFRRAETITSLEVEVGGRSIAHLAPAGLDDALGRLAGCNDRVLSNLGVDSSQASRVDRPAESLTKDQGNWFGSDDYPASALRSQVAGRVTVRFIIGTDGAVSGCRAARSSGSAALDARTCEIVTSRARYRPARDARGHAIPSPQLMTVAWQLPQIDPPPS